MGIVIQSVTFRGYKLQEAHSKDEEGIERRSVEKGISSAALSSISPTCRAKGNHFSTLHPPDFLPNVLSFSLVCLCLCLSVCLSHSMSLSDSHFFPLTHFSSLILSVWLNVYSSVSYITSLYLLNSEMDLVSLLLP